MKGKRFGVICCVLVLAVLVLSGAVLANNEENEEGVAATTPSEDEGSGSVAGNEPATSEELAPEPEDEGVVAGVMGGNRLVMAREASERIKHEMEVKAREQREKILARGERTLRERKEEVKEWRERSAEMREEMLERVRKARERYEKAKERYLKAREAYQTTKERVNDARQTFLSCREGDGDREECRQAKEKVVLEAPPFLLHAADMILAALSRVKERVEENPQMSEELREELLAKLEAQAEKAENARSVVESLSEGGATIEEVRAAAKTIRESWRETRKTLKKSVGMVVNARLGNIILRTEQLEERIRKTRDKLEERGVDVSELDAAIQEFSERLDKARSEWEAAVSLYQGATTPGEVDEAARKAHEHVRASTRYLKGVREDLRVIVREIKEANKGVLELVDEDEEGASEEAAGAGSDESEEEEAGESSDNWTGAAPGEEGGEEEVTLIPENESGGVNGTSTNTSAAP